jgi:type 1 fimbriae regulatory protein FimB
MPPCWGETAVRCESEALWLRWEDVGLEDGFLQIVSGRDGHRVKSGRSREVPMTARLRDVFRAHFAAYRLMTYDGERSPWVFHHLVAGRHQEPGERMQSMHGALYAAAKRAKLPVEFHPHDLRHRRVTTWLGEGKSPVLVKEAVGHGDLRSTMQYTNLSREHLRALVESEPRPQQIRAGEAAK